MPDGTDGPSRWPGPGGPGARGSLPNEAPGGPRGGPRSFYIKSGVPATDSGNSGDGPKASGYSRRCACGAKIWSAEMARKHQARTHQADRVVLREIRRYAWPRRGRLAVSTCALCGAPFDRGEEVVEVRVRGAVRHDVHLHSGCGRALEHVVNDPRLACSACGDPEAVLRLGIQVGGNPPVGHWRIHLRCGSCRRRVYPQAGADRSSTIEELRVAIASVGRAVDLGGRARAVPDEGVGELQVPF